MLEEWSASFGMLESGAIWVYLLKGVLFTVIISALSVFFSILFGSVLSLVRNYCNTPQTRIFRMAATFYIETFRNTPLLLWIFVCVVFCPAPGFFSHPMFGLTSVETKMLFKASVALTLYTSAVIAEIIRGGLNSVQHGQFEAGFSQGFNVVQVMYYIVLPQALRNVVPTLLSQVITTIKDSSFLANGATLELMARTRKVLSTANIYTGTGQINVSDVFMLYGLAALVYFVINFSLSLWVRRMQQQKIKAVPVKAA